MAPVVCAGDGALDKTTDDISTFSSKRFDKFNVGAGGGGGVSSFSLLFCLILFWLGRRPYSLKTNPFFVCLGKAEIRYNKERITFFSDLCILLPGTPKVSAPVID